MCVMMTCCEVCDLYAMITRCDLCDVYSWYHLPQYWLTISPIRYVTYCVSVSMLHSLSLSVSRPILLSAREAGAAGSVRMTQQLRLSEESLGELQTEITSVSHTHPITRGQCETVWR